MRQRGKSERIESVEGVLPYSAPGLRYDYLTVRLGLKRLSILLGPNAAGKTGVLETIGYALSPLMEGMHAANLYMLTTTLRPRSYAPAPLYASISLSPWRGEDREVISARSVYIDVQPPLLLESNTVFQKILSKMDTRTREKLHSEIRRDLALATELGLRFPPSFSQRRKFYDIFENFIKSMINGAVEFSALSKLSPRRSSDLLLGEPESLHRVIDRLLLRPSVLRLLYVILGHKVSKAVILEDRLGSVIIRRRGEPRLGVQAAVFHPGFIYWRGVFEALYYAYIRKGLTREDEAVDLLKHYISWFNGYELVGKELHVRTVNGKRIPVYSLSDGHRVAVFLGMLYAATRDPTIFLVDTPEAFVHPDGLAIVADVLVRLVARGNQVIIATQSIEFLYEVLRKSKEHGVEEEAVVQRLRMSPEGGVEAFAEWSSLTALQSLEKLGADLRR